MAEQPRRFLPYRLLSQKLAFPQIDTGDFRAEAGCGCGDPLEGRKP